ncbi:MAG TPA: hypothetical protein VMS17_18030 [Gemmataceae bacterium]|nr:hypothetical protein [Gemmataceae bacterium]
MTTTIEQLEAMRELPENWDGCGGAAPRPDIINLAMAYVGMMEALGAGPLHVSPTRIGGVLMEWEGGVIGHEVEFDPDGSIHSLRFNRETNEIETSEGAMLSRPI